MGNKSATTRPSTRVLDLYNTPDWAGQVLFEQVPILDGTLLELCVGNGPIARVARAKLIEYTQDECEIAGPSKNRTLWTNDIDRRHKADFHEDATDPSVYDRFPSVDWHLTNLPFNRAAEIVPLAFDHARVGVAFLLRNSYTEPCNNRAEWLIAHAGHLAYVIHLPRISFKIVKTVRPDGTVRTSKTDNASCNWYVWTKHRVAGCQMIWIPKEHHAKS